MATVQIRDMTSADEYFVGSCTHENESAELDACAARRLEWLRGMDQFGLRVKVATSDEERAGFLYVMPIEICPWGPIGRDLLVIPCLFVKTTHTRQGIGRALVKAAEAEVPRQRRKGIVTVAFYHDFWFMPAGFFENLGFSVADRKGDVGMLWKISDLTVETPRFLERNYDFKPQPGRVVVDMFYNSFCLTSNAEAQRVREISSEFGDAVVLNEYCADNPESFSAYQIPRGIFVNGHEVGWGSVSYTHLRAHET